MAGTEQVKMVQKNLDKRAESITPEMLAIFNRALEIQSSEKDMRWEDEGGRRREYYNTCTVLHRLLGRMVWMYQVVDVDPDNKPFDLPEADLADWHGAVKARLALEAASEPDVACSSA